MMATYYVDPLAYARPVPLVQTHVVHAAPVATVSAPSPLGVSPLSAGATALGASRASDDVRFDCTVSADAQGGFIATCVSRQGNTAHFAPRTGHTVCIVDPDRTGFEMACDYV